MLQRLLILVSGLLSGCLVAGTPTWQSFNQWQAACSALPTYRTLAQQGAVQRGAYTAKQNYQYSAFRPNNSSSQPNLLTRAAAKVSSKTKRAPFDAIELHGVVQAFLQQAANSNLADAACWLAQQRPGPDFYNAQKCYFKSRRVPFTPFVQKLNLAPSSRVIVRGDLHGDIHSLMAQLTTLQQLGYLDQQDGFKIVQPNCYLLFLGDYTDRGLYGAEVLYTILRLKLANPTQVYLVRGNHEDIQIAQSNGFKTELAAKFGDAHFHQLYRIYDFMPVALYVGCQREFLLCCHGGLEVGYQPQALLGSGPKVQFEQLGELRQLDFLGRVPELAAAFGQFQPLTSCYANYTPDAPCSVNGLLIGFMWNDFLVDDRSVGPVDRYNPNRGHAYNERATQMILRQQSDQRNTVCGVLRAHQHTATPAEPMMQGLLQSQGVYKLWRSYPRATETTRLLVDGLVWTFNVAPDSVYGEACDFNYDSFAILQLARRFNNWSMRVVNPIIG